MSRVGAFGPQLAGGRCAGGSIARNGAPNVRLGRGLLFAITWGNCVASQYAPVAVFALVTVAFLIALLIVGRLVRPARPAPQKLATYECGNEPVGQSWGPFHFRFYLYALLFVLFDVETAYIYPWAVRFQKLGLFAVIEMTIFLAILVLGLAYAWRKGALQWED